MCVLICVYIRTGPFQCGCLLSSKLSADRSHFSLQPSGRNCKYCCSLRLIPKAPLFFQHATLRIGPGNEASCSLCCYIIACRWKGHFINIFDPVILFLPSLHRHTPKGMELVPWVGGPSLLAKVEENLQEQQQEQLSTDSPPMYVHV